MARNITVTPEALETTANSIEQIANEYKSEVGQLFAAVTNLTQTWQGSDNVAFANQMEGFKPDLEKMYSLMTQYAEYLRTTARGYRDTQTQIVNQAKTLRN